MLRPSILDLGVYSPGSECRFGLRVWSLRALRLRLAMSDLLHDASSVFGGAKFLNSMDQAGLSRYTAPP